jgi:acyl-CoA synthetase (AMP-forming)/AMP-acid ligase II
VTTTADDSSDVLAPLAALLRDHPAGSDDAVLHTPDGSLSLGELKAAAERVAEALRASCVDAGSPVACIVDGGVSAIAVMFGTWLVGGVHVPLNGRSTDHELEMALDALHPAAVVGRPRTLQTGVRWVVEATPQQWHASACFPWFGERLPKSTALLMRTSGTTGEAKTIALSHEGVLEGIDRVLRNLRGGRSSGSRMPNLVPSSQALWAGVWNGLFALRAGAPVVLLDRFEPAAYAELVRRFEIRSTVLAPAMMAMLVADPDVTDLAPLRRVRSITAPLTPQQARSFREKFGVGVMNCYGQTELGSEVVGWTAADLEAFGEDKLGAVGRPHSGVSLKVITQDGQPARVGEVGEIWVASPSASPSPEIAARLVDGHLRTGDLGRLDDDGFLWLEGRVADVINRGGLKVLPQEVEDALRNLPGVADACVAGVPDDRLGEVPVAWVVPEAGAHVDAEDAVRALREVLTGYKIPVAVHVREDFPRNEVGKVLRRVLVEELA